MHRRTIVCLLACLLGCLRPTLAAANGRYPHSQKVYVVPGHANRLVVRTTFGLLESIDGGASWYHVCERVVFGTRVNYDLDLLLEVANDGALLSGSWHGLRVSRDGGCSWETESALPVDPVFFEGAPRNHSGAVVDLTRSARGNLYALVTRNDATGEPDHHAIFVSYDSARTWQPVGNAIPRSSADAMLTLEVAPDDEAEILATGRTGEGAVTMHTVDGGMTWERREMGARLAPDVYLLPPSPHRPGSLFARGRVRSGTDGARDELYHSSDRGGSWQTVLSKRAGLLGFAISPDGSIALAAFGDTGYVQDGVQLDDTGIYRASTSSLAFEKIFAGNTTCLDWYASGLYACSGLVGGAFHLGVAQDADFELGDHPFRSLLKLPGIEGPLPWATPAPNGFDCATDWRVIDPGTHEVVGGLCQKLGACRDGSPNGIGPPFCGDRDGGPGNEGGSGGVSGGGAGSHAGTDPATGGGGRCGRDPEGSSGRSSRAGCGCRIGERPHRVGGDGIAVVLLGSFGARRRRGFSRRRPRSLFVSSGRSCRANRP